MLCLPIGFMEYATGGHMPVHSEDDFFPHLRNAEF